MSDPTASRRCLTWPRALWIIRHGESAGNLAWKAADAAGLDRIDLAQRDMDIPLSPRGEGQADALGKWFGALAVAERPTAILTSPYVRARRTAEIARNAAGFEIPIVADERLREREFGIIDGLTKQGIQAQLPKEAEHRARIGKFYYRPPGGESWCDVFLRLRSVVDSLTRDYTGDRVVVIAHEVVVMGFRYILEAMTEEGILAVDRAGDVANCAVTSYAFDPGARTGVSLGVFNYVAPLVAAGEPVTRAPDVPVAPK